jgi:hypothetical protein
MNIDNTFAVSPASTIKKYLFIFFISYLCIFTYFSLIHSERQPAGGHLFIQIALLVFFVFFLYSSLNVAISGVISLILFYQMMLSLFIYGYFLNILGEPFGYNPRDALQYLQSAEYSLDHTLSELILYLQLRNTEIADYGFPFVRFFIFKLAGSRETGILFMVIANTVSVAIGSWYLYKLSLFSLEKNSSKIVALFWGLNSCSVVINVMGCKESIFTTLLIIAMYQLYYYYYKKKDIFHFFLSIICIMATIFFRIYLAVFFLIIMLFRPLYSEKYKGVALLAVVLLTGITTYISYFVSSEFPVLNRLLINQQAKSDTLFVNMITGFLGPYPNFLQSQDPNSFFWGPYSGFKAFFSFFALYGGWYILKNQITKLYPMFFFVFFNILLVIGTVRSFDYRFVYTMIPFFFILMLYGINRFQFKYKALFSSLYFSFIFLLVFNYNLR